MIMFDTGRESSGLPANDSMQMMARIYSVLLRTFLVASFLPSSSAVGGGFTLPSLHMRAREPRGPISVSSASFGSSPAVLRLTGGDGKKRAASSIKTPVKKQAGAADVAMAAGGDDTIGEAEEKPDTSRNWDVSKVRRAAVLRLFL